MRLIRTISIGKDKVLFGVYPDGVDHCPDLQNVVGIGNNFAEAVDDLLRQVPRYAYLDKGQDWDDGANFIDTEDYDFIPGIEVNFGDYIVYSN